MRTASSSSAATRPTRTRSCSAASRRRRRAAGDEDHLLRPAPHRHGGTRRPVPADPARHRRDAVPRPAAHHAVGRLDEAGVHRRAHQRLRRAEGVVRECTPELVAQTCGIAKEDLFTAAKWFATSPATLSLYCQGLNQSSSGTAKNAALINLHLATAQIGKPGAGPFSLTGSRMRWAGARWAGWRTCCRRTATWPIPQHRAEVARCGACLRCRRSRARPRWRCSRPRRRRDQGAVDRLHQPRAVDAGPGDGARALERAEFVVVQEAFATTATCDYADLLLPATTWGEKDGTVTNSERRISRVRRRWRRRGARGTTGRSRWSSRGGWSAASGPLPQAGEGARHAVPLPHPRIHLARTPRIHARPRPRHHRPHLPLLERAPQQWPFPEGATTGRRASTKTASSPPRRQGALRRRQATSRWPNRASRATPSR
jgi:assimilatory nitrate reductase catalytic subunit